MDWNLNTPTEWDWENLAIYTSKDMEVVPKNLQFSSQEETVVVVDDVDFSFSAASVSKETIKSNFVVFDDLPKDFLEKDESSWAGDQSGSFSNVGEEASVLSGEAMIGLKLGRHATSCNNINKLTTTASVPLFPTSSPMIKRSRASYLSSQSPRCQVEGCNLDLASAKDYHRRHRICANHSKSPKVIVAGMERRFCQQCSRKLELEGQSYNHLTNNNIMGRGSSCRFHDLSEFDDRKRSCRRRLSAHNARRRRPQSEEIQFGSTGMSASICDRRPAHMSFLLNRGGSIPVLDSAPPESSSCSFKGNECLIGLSKAGGIHDVMPTTNGAINFSSERFVPRNAAANHNAGTMDANSNSSILCGDVGHAFSLLSTSSCWSSNWGEEPSSAFDDQFAAHSSSNNNNISLAQPGMPALEQLQTNTTHLQDFQSFRSPHDQFERFYSN